MKSSPRGPGEAQLCGSRKVGRTERSLNFALGLDARRSPARRGFSSSPLHSSASVHAAFLRSRARPPSCSARRLAPPASRAAPLAATAIFRSSVRRTLLRSGALLLCGGPPGGSLGRRGTRSSTDCPRSRRCARVKDGSPRFLLSLLSPPARRALLASPSAYRPSAMAPYSSRYGPPPANDDPLSE